MWRFKNYSVTYKSYSVSFINYTVTYKKMHCKFEWENRVRDKKKSFEWDIAKSLLVLVALGHFGLATTIILGKSTLKVPQLVIGIKNILEPQNQICEVP